MSRKCGCLSSINYTEKRTHSYENEDKSCNDSRTLKECNEPYRIIIPSKRNYCCEPKPKEILNISAPVCLLSDPTYRGLYDTLYNAILNNNLETALSNMIQTNYPTAYDALLAQLLTIFGITLGSASPRLVVVQSDGSVIYDTSKSAASPNANTYANWVTDQSGQYYGNGASPVVAANPGIDPNHNTRMAIMTAQMFPCGVGYETKYSSTVGTPQAYVAVRAGVFTNDSGTFRLSVNA